ncbi:MAG: SPOR domain-containing protein [Thiomonas sp.]
MSSVRSVPVCRAAGWYVQVGAFSQPRSIQRLAQHLHRAGYAEVCVAARQVRGLRLFYVGPYRDARAARTARAALHKIVGTEGILRRLP